MYLNPPPLTTLSSSSLYWGAIWDGYPEWTLVGSNAHNLNKMTENSCVWPFGEF